MTPRGCSVKSSGAWFDRGRARQGAGRGQQRALFRVSEPAPPAVTRPAGARSPGWRGGSCIRRRRFGCSATCCWSSPARPDAILPPMDEPYRIVDLGVRRVLAVDGREYPTRYSERVIRMLIERKGVRRAPLYFDFKETRGRHFLGPLFRYLHARGAHELEVLEVGCSFGHMTEYLADQPEVARIHTFDTDPAFVALTRAKVQELGLGRVREVAHISHDATRRLPWADG